MNLDDSPVLLELSNDQIASAHRNSAASGRPLLDELADISGQTGRALIGALALRLNLPVLETSDMQRLQPALDRLPLAKALERGAVLLRDPAASDSTLIAVTPDAFDLSLRSWLEAQARGPVRIALALAADIQAYLTKLEAGARAVSSFLRPVEESAVGRGAIEEISFSSATQEASSAVKIVNSTLYDALKSGSSDIHLESSEDGLTVRYRIDGILDEAARINGIDLGEQVISRLKVLAELDIAEHRVPQDGSFRIRSGGRDIDLRVSVMPSVHGEDAVVRILDKQRMLEATGTLTLDTLGFDAGSLAIVRGLLEQPYGMLLVTGPTGSGKTTTLYSR